MNDEPNMARAATPEESGKLFAAAREYRAKCEAFAKELAPDLSAVGQRHFALNMAFNGLIVPETGKIDSDTMVWTMKCLGTALAGLFAQAGPEVANICMQVIGHGLESGDAVIPPVMRPAKGTG